MRHSHSVCTTSFFHDVQDVVCQTGPDSSRFQHQIFLPNAVCLFISPKTEFAKYAICVRPLFNAMASEFLKRGKHANVPTLDKPSM